MQLAQHRLICIAKELYGIAITSAKHRFQEVAALFATNPSVATIESDGFGPCHVGTLEKQGIDSLAHVHADIVDVSRCT